MDTSRVIKNLIKDKRVASITPSSLSSVKKVCERIDFSKENVIVEFGPGTGVFTRYILTKMNSSSKLISIEINRNFYEHLKKTITDERVIFCNMNAKNITFLLKKYNIDHVDYIISGIPFSILSKEVKDEIVKKSYKSLKTDGKFLAYQWSNTVKKYLEKYFTTVKSAISGKNIPPLIIYEATK